MAERSFVEEVKKLRLGAGARMAPATVRELRDAALADEHGEKLRAALQRHGLGTAAADVRPGKQALALGEAA
jgi:hypothetical protein